MKKLIKKILKEDRRQMYLDKIVQVMKGDYPFFKNMELYGFEDQLSHDEYRYIFKKIFGETARRRGYKLFNKNNNELYNEYSDGYWEKYEYDENGKLIYFEDSEGFWEKREYDENGNEIYSVDSDGYWEKYEYDENDNKIYFENSSGEIRDNR